MLDYKKLSSTLLFIFGGSGDLNYRKLTPALYNLFLDNAMPDKFGIVGIARTEYTDADYKKHLKEGIDQFSRAKDNNGKWKEFSKNISYLKMDVADESHYKNLADIAKAKEKEAGEHLNIIFYMAVAPQLVPIIVKQLGKLEICHDTKCTRIIVEKPFGHDLETAKELNVPMVALSQLSRSVEQRGGDKRPVLSDLRESGAIEQDADIVSFIYRPEYYGFMEDEAGQSNQGVGEIIIAKHRNGALDSVRLRFIGEFARFENFNSFTDDADFSGGSNSLTGKSDFEKTNVTIKSKMSSFDDDGSDFDNAFNEEVPF